MIFHSMIPGDNRKISKVPSTAGLTVVEKRTLDSREGGRARVPSRPPFDTAKRFRDCALSACASLSRFHFALFAATLHLLSRKASRIDPLSPPPSPLSLSSRLSSFTRRYRTAISSTLLSFYNLIFPVAFSIDLHVGCTGKKGGANESVVSA